MSADRPVVQTRAGAVRGEWRGESAAFLGIPFAEAPVGDLRFAAPVPARPWDGVREADHFGPTPQRRPFGAVTTIPEPSFPGDATLNVNVFTPAPGDADAKLPVLVWIHGGGFFAGSPSSPWYDGASYNRDGVVTVSLSYRLGFDGFGWIADAPTNRGVLDMIAGLEWVRDNIAAFGGDPDAVTISGQSAGGAAVLTLLSAPSAQSLFARVIAHSGAALSLTLDKAEEIGKGFAAKAGVEPTRAGWSALSEDAVLDLQQELTAMDFTPPASPADFVRSTLASGGLGLAFVPLVGDDVVPFTLADAIARGIGTDKDLLIGTVAHEFTMANMPLREAWANEDAVAALTEGGLSPGGCSGVCRRPAGAHLDRRPVRPADHRPQLPAAERHLCRRPPRTGVGVRLPLAVPDVGAGVPLPRTALLLGPARSRRGRCLCRSEPAAGTRHRHARGMGAVHRVRRTRAGSSGTATMPRSSERRRPTTTRSAAWSAGSRLPSRSL